MATMFDQWASNFPTWDQLTPAQRVMYGGDPTSYETIRSAHIRNAMPWVQQGLNTLIDADTLAKLNAARAANPSGRVSIGESDAGQLWAHDPTWAVGDYTIGEDGSIWKSLQRKTWGQDVGALYDDQGRLIGIGSGDSTALGLAKFIAMSAAAYGGVNAADSALTAMSTAPTTGAAAGGAGGMTAAEQAAMMAANGMTDAQIAAALGTQGAQAAGLAGVGGGAAAAGAGALVNGAKDVMGSGGLNWGGVLGAAAGALDSRDEEQKQSRDPWEPAQGFLKQQIGQGQDLSNRYQANPFSADQMAAYNNQFGLLNAINQNAGGLLGGFNANASGANQFVRGQPQRLQGSTFNLGGYTPGLLTGFTRG